ncbi:hypothetical protein N7U66_01980 [Lacinutrix neustonica]|uniref:Uncharacterized protein n=1 Tax=Lacinutrix neustonica TaxID=2980107 RepID=A0A9E8MYC1_9FLAO|nr:hypothetical protein [Lacinutrix neustonica]WAC02505.1 hypothetical protein N7U66_01980 [Lacinutrix neustonica]
MKSVIKVMRLVLKYGAVIFTVIEIIEFATEKLEKYSDTKNVSNSHRKMNQNL